MKYSILLLFCLFIGTLDLCLSVLFTSADYNIESNTNSIIGLTAITSVVAFYIIGLVILIYVVAFSSEYAEAAALEAMQKEQAGRSVQGANDRTSFLGSFLNSALNIDSGHCLAKFLCELETDSFWQKRREEKFLFDIFGDYFIENILEEGKYRNDLKKAKLVGRQTSNIKLCKDSFNQCGFSLQDLSTAWKAALSFRRTFDF
ncbi:UNVERIFIED_CONTAM: hypothetical protein RMT77_012176 [Armadillidium vulgare]